MSYWLICVPVLIWVGLGVETRYEMLQENKKLLGLDLIPCLKVMGKAILCGPFAKSVVEKL
jgi:hypothetical protein